MNDDRLKCVLQIIPKNFLFLLLDNIIPVDKSDNSDSILSKAINLNITKIMSIIAVRKRS